MDRNYVCQGYIRTSSCHKNSSEILCNLVNEDGTAYQLIWRDKEELFHNRKVKILENKVEQCVFFRFRKIEEGFQEEKLWEIFFFNFKNMKTFTIHHFVYHLLEKSLEFSQQTYFQI